jgi:PAS domain-containing protein
MAERDLTQQLLGAVRDGAPIYIVRAGGDGIIREASAFAENLAGRPLAGAHVAQVFVHFDAPGSLEAALHRPARGRLMHVATEQGLPFEIYADISCEEGGTLLVGHPDVPAMLRERRQFLDLQAQLHHNTRASLKRSYMQLEQSERRHQTILDAAGDGIVAMDAEGRFTYTNEAARRLLGLVRDEPVDAGVQPRFLHGPCGHLCNPGCPVLADNGPAAGDLSGRQLFRRQDCSDFSADFVCTPLRERGRAAGAVLVFRDASERVAAENLLKARAGLSEVALRGAPADILLEAVDAAQRLTGSAVGFFHFVTDGERSLDFTVWSSDTLRGQCRMAEQSGSHPLRQGGIWAESIARREAVIRNDGVAGAMPLPEGHVGLRRVMTVPVLRDGAVHGLASVGNKPGDYQAREIGRASCRERVS